MKAFLRYQNDDLSDAKRFDTKAAAMAAFEATARDLARYGQPIEASLHYADTLDDIGEYPDAILSLGPRGGLRCDPCY